MKRRYNKQRNCKECADNWWKYNKHRRGGYNKKYQTKLSINGVKRLSEKYETIVIRRTERIILHRESEITIGEDISEEIIIESFGSIENFFKELDKDSDKFKTFETEVLEDIHNEVGITNDEVNSTTEKDYYRDTKDY